ncbi:unnamed protein product [Closterium sp. Naga37s-1]|nr:unnamed protein product [Closterium sp. Naga37s-1]
MDEIYEDPEYAEMGKFKELSVEDDESEGLDDTAASVEAAVKLEEEIVTMEVAAVNGGDGDDVNTFAAVIVVEDEAVNAKCVGVEAVKGDIMVKGSKAAAAPSAAEEAAAHAAAIAAAGGTAAAVAAPAAGATGGNVGAAAAVAEARPLVCRQYSLAEVAATTGEWAEANRIGSGSFGDVYKGANPTAPHDIWAVKRAKVLTNDFKREVNEMATKSHPHLVRLLGYCLDISPDTERMEQIVIYEFVDNGDLDRWIGPSEPFNTRTSMPCFGVVMLTLITARKAIYNADADQINLKQWVAPLLAAGDAGAMRDPQLEAPDDLVLRMARLALRCTAMPTASRPSISRVLGELLVMKEEFLGQEEDRMAARIDRELESSSDVNLSMEIARAQGARSSGGISSNV